MDKDFANKDNRYSRQVLFSPIGNKGQKSTEAFKLLTGNKKDMVKGLINIDIWDLSLDIIKIKVDKDNKCPVCSTG